MKGSSKNPSGSSFKVVSINYPWLRIKTGDGIIEIIEHGFDTLPEVGEYL